MEHRKQSVQVDTSEVLESIQLAKKLTGLSYEEIVEKSGYNHINIKKNTCALRIKCAVLGVIFLETTLLAAKEKKQFLRNKE